MTKQHLKRINAPRTWTLKKKQNVFIVRPNPGSHSMKLSMPLLMIIRDILGYARTKREVVKLLNDKVVNVNTKRVKDYKHPLGIMDTLSLDDIDEHYRVMINKKGRLCLNKTKKERTKIRPVKIQGKTTLPKNKTQLNFSDGTNLIADAKDYAVGDTLIIEYPNKIVQHIKIEPKAYVYFIKGKHVGESGIIEKVLKEKIFFKMKNGKTQETSKTYAFVVGKEKSEVVLPE